MMRRHDLALLSMFALSACGSDPATVPHSNTGPVPSMPSGAAGAAGVQAPGAVKPGDATKPGSGTPDKGNGGAAQQPGKPVAPAIVEQAQSTKARIEDPAVADTDRAQLAKGNRALAFQLYKELAGQPANLFFSPYSLSSALAMTYAGAKGKTADQMRATLHFDLPDERLHPAFNATDRELSGKSGAMRGDDSARFTLDVANALWAQRGEPFLGTYLDVLGMHYGAGVQVLDFATNTEAARQTINAWVEDKTHDRIKELLKQGDLTELTAFVLTNAIYFKAKWSSEFDEAATKDAPFHAPSGDETAKMMHRVLNTSYTRGEGYQTVALPYAESSIEMLLILPDAGKLADVESRFDETMLASIGEDASGYMVNLALPRFTFESRFEVAEVLAKLGMPDAFSDAADFSGMNGKRNIRLDKVIHQAFVAVDEKGTEAAAATAVTGVFTSAPLPMPAVEVTVDRPFIVVIRERRQGDILFLGRVQSVKP